MKGKIYNTENGWVIEYTDWKYSGGNPKQLGGYNRKLGIITIPLHPEDVKLFEKLPEYVDSGSKVRFKKIKINPLGREVDPLNLGQNQSGCIWVGKLIPEVEDDRVIQKQHIINMMKSDEELGLYDEKIEDIELEEVRGSSSCQFSVVENKLSIIYRNQLKILQAIKMLNNGKRN